MHIIHRKNERIQVIHKENAGVAAARNTGLNAARGKYILFIDADDMILPSACADLVQRAERYSADVVMGNYYWVDENGKAMGDSVEGVERQDYWANELFLPENERLDSRFEKALHETELSSGGRIKIERAAVEDLEYFANFADSDSAVTIPGVDKVLLSETFQEGQNKAFQYIWQEAKDEILL
jgi:glycosyltransferase involved in cell wall biosynthesis